MTNIQQTLGINKQRPVIENIYDSGVVNMGANPIQLPNNPIKANYPVDCLLVKVLLNITVGTGTLGSVPIATALQNLQLNDNNNGVICNFLGADIIAEMYLRSFIKSTYYGSNNLDGDLAYGSTALTVNIANGSNEIAVLMKIPVKNKDLGLKILGNMNSLSSLYTTQGTGTATFELVIDAVMYPTIDPVYTGRTQKTNTGAAVPIGTSLDISQLIPAGVVIDLIVLSIGADANLIALTLDPNGNATGIVQETIDSLKNSAIPILRPNSRQAGFVILDVGQFSKTSKTKFTIDVATGFTPYAFIIWHPITDTPKVSVPSSTNPGAAAATVAASAPAAS